MIWEWLSQSEHQNIFPVYNKSITPTLVADCEDQNYQKSQRTQPAESKHPKSS